MRNYRIQFQRASNKNELNVAPEIDAAEKFDSAQRSDPRTQRSGVSGVNGEMTKSFTYSAALRAWLGHKLLIAKVN